MAMFHPVDLGELFGFSLPIALDFLLATAIGAERQYRQRSAGLRTNVLVAVGAASFVSLGLHLNAQAGASQIAAYVVSGIGFLGAGVIMKEGSHVWGSTPRRPCGVRPRSARSAASISPPRPAC
jgi:putative Mg2+ transporter-C (MgtC) family protein